MKGKFIVRYIDWTSYFGMWKVGVVGYSDWKGCGNLSGNLSCVEYVTYTHHVSKKVAFYEIRGDSYEMWHISKLY